MKAIIADIHGNLEALRAVLDDIASHEVHGIYCLGDIVGYGPNPRECIDLLYECRVVLLGDHDLSAAGGESHSTPTSRRSDVWTRRQLAVPIPDRVAARRRFEFLTGLPISHREGDYLFVHGGPRDPVNEYLFPEDIYDERKMKSVFALVDHYCFMGHTHIPGIFTEDLRFISPKEINGKWYLNGYKMLCNVGSVGQPRDGDERACYVLLDCDAAQFRRVAYDIDVVIRKMNGTDDS